MHATNATFLALAAGHLLLASDLSSAVSLVPGRATDSSVCDLGPNTTRFFASKVLIPAVAPPEDQVAAQFRLAGQFVAENCSDGQVLIVGGSADVDTDSPALTQLASSSCRVADVRRTEGSGSIGPYAYVTFELRCPITKVAELKSELAELEAKDPLASLKVRLANSARAPARSSSSSSPAAQKDCNAITLGSLVGGGGCR